MRTFLMLVAVAALCRTSRAQPEPPSRALALFEEGRHLLDAGQPGPACERFEASLKLEPDALGTILNLGLCNEQLDRVATALKWFRRVQSRALELGKTDTEAAAKDKTIALAAKVPTITIAFSGPPPTGAIVLIDGTKVAEIDYLRVEVDAGTHVIDATMLGQPPTHDSVAVADGDAKVVTLQLARPPPPAMILIDRGARQRHQAYMLVGVGGLLLAGDTVLGIIARNRYNATDMLDTRDHWRDVMRYGGTSLFLVGGAAIAGGVWMYLHAPGEERVVVPAIGPDRVGVTLTGKF